MAAYMYHLQTLVPGFLLLYTYSYVHSHVLNTRYPTTEAQGWYEVAVVNALILRAAKHVRVVIQHKQMQLCVCNTLTCITGVEWRQASSLY